jgi:hypothetical protein
MSAGERGSGFDVVIGNPPYGKIFGDRELAVLEDELPESASTRDASAIFLERCRSLAPGGGRCGMIVPLNAARIDKFRSLRKLLAEEATPYRIVDEGNPFHGDVELEMISVFFDEGRGEEVEVRSHKPVGEQPGRMRLSDIRRHDYRFFIYWDELWEYLLSSGELGRVEVSQGVPRRADYTEGAEVLCLGAISLDPYTLRWDVAQMDRTVDTDFVRGRGLEDQLAECVITPFSLGKTGKVTDMALECVLKPEGYLPDGTAIFVDIDEGVGNKKGLLLLNSQLVNYLSCRYLLSYGVRIFRGYIFEMLPVPPGHRGECGRLAELLSAATQLAYDGRVEGGGGGRAAEVRRGLAGLADCAVYDLYLGPRLRADGAVPEGAPQLLERLSGRLPEPEYDEWAELYWMRRINGDLDEGERARLGELGESLLRGAEKLLEEASGDRAIAGHLESVLGHKWVRRMEGVKCRELGEKGGEAGDQGE